MKRLVYSSNYSNYYTTKKDNLMLIDKNHPDYYPFAQSKNFQRRPGAPKKTRAVKWMQTGEVDVIDSLTDDIDVVLTELNNYKNSTVWPVAKLLINSINYFTRSNRYVSSDEIDELEAAIESAYNLEILEAALNEFVQMTGREIMFGYTGNSVDGKYVGGIPAWQKLLSGRDIYKILSGKWSVAQILENMLLPRDKTNAKNSQ